MTEIFAAASNSQDVEVYSNPYDVLHHLIIYIEYIGAHEVKRMVRTNQLPKNDYLRIARLMGDPDIEQIVKEQGSDSWIDFIDSLALTLKLVDYNIEGEYRGYNSSSPSFINNFVTVIDRNYNAFLDLSPVEQERLIFDTLITQRNRSSYDSTNNEFYSQSVLGRLDSFSSRGSALGIMPMLDFTTVRRFLSHLLQRCKAGEWYSTSSLVAYLKANHPFFLIPEKLPADRYGRANERYYNFHDGPDRWGNDDSFVPLKAADAFERVEGRYVERFLEGAPLTMRFVELAYLPAAKQNVFPSLGWLTAFRVNERFLHLMGGDNQPPRVTVQPNFDIIVESEFYPARLMRTLTSLAAEVSNPAANSHVSVVTLQLKKELIAKALVRDPNLDVAALLRQLSGRDLPPNVAIEIAEWSNHAEQFTLYDGFSLLESNSPQAQAEASTVERISPVFSLVRQAGDLELTLAKAGLAPLSVEHDPANFELLHEAVHSIFPKILPAPAAPDGPETITLKRSSKIVLNFSASPQAFEDFRKALAEARCPIQADAAHYSITFSSRHQPLFDTVLQQLADKYQVSIQDLAD